MIAVAAVSALALLFASPTFAVSPLSNRQLVDEAVENAFFGRRCVPASRPRGGPAPDYFELRLLEARLEAAVAPLADSGEEIDLEEIRAEFRQSLAGAYFLPCKPHDPSSAKVRRRFKGNVLELERRAVAAAVEKQISATDYDGDGIIGSMPPHID